MITYYECFECRTYIKTKYPVNGTRRSMVTLGEVQPICIKKLNNDTQYYHKYCLENTGWFDKAVEAAQTKGIFKKPTYWEARETVLKKMKDKLQ